MSYKRHNSMMIIHIIIYGIIRHIVLYDVNKYPYIVEVVKVSNEISIKIPYDDYHLNFV